MRVVSWNMNVLDRTSTHNEGWTFLLETLEPDIALLQEVIVPQSLPEGWQVMSTPGITGKAWGSAILSRVGTLVLDWEDHSRGAVLVAHGSVPLLGAISVACIHARVIGHRVIPALRETFEALRPWLGERFIVGGDLNTARAAARAWPENGHGEFWRDVQGWGFTEAMPFNGEERQSYWREWLRDEPPTVGNTLQDDHVLFDAGTFDHVTRSRIWDTRRIRELSDHGPVVVDLAPLPNVSRGVGLDP